MNIKTLLIIFPIVIFASTCAARADVQIWPEAATQVFPNNQMASNGECNCPQSCGQHAAYVHAPPVYILVQQSSPPPPPPPRTIIAREDRSVYFGFDKSTLTNEAKSKLNTLANRLTSADDVTGARVLGYADRIGTVSYNLELSKRRAENVREYLIDRGFIKPSVTETHWVGKSEPSTSCSRYLPRAQLIRCLQPDRKVEVEIAYRAETQAQR